MPVGKRQGARAHSCEPWGGQEIQLEGGQQEAGYPNYGTNWGEVTNYEIFLLMDDLPGRIKRAVAHGVESVGEFCGVAGGAADEMKSSWERIMLSSCNSCEGSSRTGQEPPYWNGGERPSGGYPCRPRTES
jgi:hypothetical protein